MSQVKSSESLCQYEYDEIVQVLQNSIGQCAEYAVKILERVKKYKLKKHFHLSAIL